MIRKWPQRPRLAKTATGKRGFVDSFRDCRLVGHSLDSRMRDLSRALATMSVRVSDPEFNESPITNHAIFNPMMLIRCFVAFRGASGESSLRIMGMKNVRIRCRSFFKLGLSVRSLRPPNVIRAFAREFLNRLGSNKSCLHKHTVPIRRPKFRSF